MTALARSFGMAVRRSREAHGWSQERLAEAADLNRSYIGEIERGSVAVSLLTVEKLARSLGLSASALVSQGEAIDRANLVRGLQLTAIAC